MTKSMNFYSFTNSNPESRTSIHSLPFYIGIFFVILIPLMLFIVSTIDANLPSPLMLKDEKSNPDAFIAERASWDLKNLTNIGPRVVGSYENEILTVNYLTGRINSIIKESHFNQFLELDIQLVSGAYYLGDDRKGKLINTYDRIQNVIVKLNGKNGTNSVLVNSHFDSVPTSPGGSDDGINVATMLEILRILSKSEERPLHNIIFLFNGAEETPLQASHGFITQHYWAKACRVVLNLDAAGSGGRIILFQTGPETPWLVKYYQNVPHPFAQAAGEELFQTGLLPCDTDYRIFRDFGNLVGLDMAFIKNGYRYHTKFDRFSYIPLGSYQHVGDNALSLIKSFSNAPELFEPVPTKGKSVYYDIFGLFLISYSSFLGSILNIFTILLSLMVFLYSMFSFKLGFSKSSLKFLAIASAAILGSWILSGIFVFILCVITDLLGRTMSWYRNSWMVLGLFAIPSTGLSGCLLLFTNHENMALNIRCQIQAHIVRLIFTVLLTFGVSFHVRSSYAIMIPVLFSSLAFIAIHAMNIQHSIKKWQIIYALFQIFPMMNLMYQALITFSLFIPMTGFIGSDKNPDLIIGLGVVVFSILILAPLTAMTNVLRNARYYFIFLACVFGIFLIFLFTPLGFPYSGNKNYPTPERQWILHTSRRFFNESGNLAKSDAGFFFLNLDRNSPRILKKYVKELNRAVPFDEECKIYAGCGMPLSHHKMLQIVEYGTWVPSAEEPVLPEPVNFKSHIENITQNEIKYNIWISGPDRITIYLIPTDQVSITNISLVNAIETPIIKFQDRPMYFIYFQSGREDVNFNFTFNVLVPDHWQGGPTVNLSIVGRYVHTNKMKKTPQYSKLLEDMPEWTDVVAWLFYFNSQYSPKNVFTIHYSFQHYLVFRCAAHCAVTVTAQYATNGRGFAQICVICNFLAVDF